MEEEDIGRWFDAAQAFIDGALADGGAVLVHCHEGKSRSVTLILAYFMKTKVPALQTICESSLQFIAELLLPSMLHYRYGTIRTQQQCPAIMILMVGQHVAP